MKKLAFVLATGAVLVGAGAAGAVVALQSNLFMRVGQTVQLRGTNAIVCQGQTAADDVTLSLKCTYSDNHGARAGSYGAFINQAALYVYRYDANRKEHFVKKWNQPK
jgi:hypothetical protein